MSYKLYLQARRIGCKQKLGEIQLTETFTELGARELAKSYREAVKGDATGYYLVRTFKELITRGYHQTYNSTAPVFKVVIRESKD